MQQNLTQLEILQGRGEPLGLTNIFHFSKHPVTQADLSYQSSQLTPDFLSAFDIPLIAGRNISEQEWQDKAKVMLINENLAQLLSPDQPIESLLNTEFEKAKIIGIVGNTFNLMTRNKLQAISYQHLNYQTQQEIKLLMQLPAGEAFATQTLQQLALAFDPSIDQVEMRTLNEYWNAATADTRMLFYFTNLLTLLTLALAAIGMAGLATSLTEQKRFELAIRMATGASRNQLLRLVLAQASWLLFSGLCAGVIFATLVYTSLQPKIASLPAFDLMPIILIDLLLIIIVLIATLWPAKRIINRAPMQALREL
ncbi:FtsX-like permease family protein [Pseudoalteromonas tunicata]|uniref:FtsX-like permease family protein n=1 Tax=Pseudoalteromonas tunicata TaxID=314281 RepID=UPI00351B9151